MRRRTLLGATALVSVLPLFPWKRVHAQDAKPVTYSPDDLAHAAVLRELGLADREAWPLVQGLVNDVGARPAGSAADAMAAAWALAAMKRLALENTRIEPVPLKIWQRGPASATLVAPQGQTKNQPLVMAALGNSVATPDAGIEADIAWYPDFAALKADSSDRARGRIVFIDGRTERTRSGSGYGSAVVARALGAVEAGKRGALAVGIRSIATGDAPVAHTGAMRYEIGVPQIPAFAVAVPDADRLAALQSALPDGKALRLQLQLQARSDVDATTHNVIGEVPGTDLASEIVLIGAHLDSWDLGVGAIDDGAGVAIVTAAAALLQRLAKSTGKRPRRTVRVVLFGNEENGFDGVRAYADRYKDQVHQMVGESDFGAGKVYRLQHRVQPAALPLMHSLAQVLAPLGVGYPPDGANAASPSPDAGFLMRRMRWPGMALEQDGSDYFDAHHSNNDTLARIDPATLPQNVACWAVTAWLAAQAPVAFGPPGL